MKKIGVALGGGGAKGLAHIAMLEVLDEFDVDVHMVSGTSIGAIIGALYAAGRSASEMREAIAELTETPRTLKEAWEAKELPAWLGFIDVDVGRSSLLKVDRFLAELEEAMGVSTFEALPTPLKIVASDFWAREQVVFDSGPLLPAIAASFALPGIFKPVVLDGRVLIDGGSVNPVPYDLLLDSCDITIAIDVIGKRKPGDELIPSYTETLFNTFQISEKTIVVEKLKACAPTIYIEPEIEDVRVLEFHKADEIYVQAGSARDELRRALTEALR